MPRNRMFSIVLAIFIFLQILTVGYNPLSEPAHAAAVATPPTVKSMNPDPAAHPTITGDRMLEIQFSESVRRGTGSIQLINLTAPAQKKQYDVKTDTDNVQWKSQDTVVIKTGLSNGNYYMEISNDAFIGVDSGLNFAGISGTSSYSFMVADFPEPALGPQYVDIDHLNNTNFTLTFDRNMSKGTGSIQIKKAATNDIAQTIPVSEAIINNTTITLPIKRESLDYNTQYYILIDPGAFVDSYANPYAGISDTLKWNFTTADKFDVDPPTVVAYSPSVTLGTLKNLKLSMTFNEPVLVGTGSIEIYKSINHSPPVLSCSIPVASSLVKIDSSDKKTVSIDPSVTCPAFVNGVTYTVNVDKDALRDQTGNPFSQIPGSWTFTADNTPPSILSYSPTPGTSNVSADITELSMTFNEPVKVKSGYSGPGPILFAVNNSSPQIPLMANADTRDNRKINLTGYGGKLKPNTKYSVTIPGGLITDLAESANPFAGILNMNQWTFDSYGAGGIPILNKAEMDGSAVVLTYSEILNPANTPSNDNFYVTVNDVNRPVSGVTIIGNQVKLVLQTGILFGQIVKLSYILDPYADARKIQTFSGKQAAGFTNKDVTNTADTTLPRPISGTAGSTNVTLNFNKSLAALGSYAYSQFSVQSNGQGLSVNSASVSGSMLVLSLPYVGITNGSISVSYTPGSYPLRDLAGNLVNAFSNFYISNPYDKTPPNLTSSTSVGNKLVLTFDEAIRSTPLPSQSNFSVLVNGAATAISSITVNNNVVELTLSGSVAVNQIVILTYAPSSTGLMDLAGNQITAINGLSIVGGDSTLAKLTTATVNGSSLTLSYSASLSSSNTPQIYQYAVKADGINAGVGSVSVSGSQVNLNLLSTIRVGQRVTVAFTNTGTQLKDAQNQVVASLTDTAVTNVTSSSAGSGSLPSYLEANSLGGLRMNTNVMTKTSTKTPSGSPAFQYAVDSDKLETAFSTIKSNATQMPMMAIPVPSTEAGAVVSLPLRALINAGAMVSNGIVRVEYDGTSMELPLQAFQNSQLLQSLGSGSSPQIIVKIEKTPNTTLSTAINAKGAQLIGLPVDFTTVLAANGAEKEITSFDVYVPRTITVNMSGVNASDITVVRLDSDSGEVNYVPTTTETSGNSLLVHFKRKGNSTYAVVQKTPVNFQDMTKHWARSDVTLLASKFIVDGLSPTQFGPDQNITRADFAEFIGRGLGLTGDRSAANRYPDVSRIGSSAAYIGAATKAGIVTGDTSGSFRPGALITREEMASMLVRAMGYTGTQGSASSTVLNVFNDRAKIGAWAKDAVAICVQNGLIYGVTPQKIDPKNNATRAQAASMIKRFLKAVDFLP